MRTVREEWFEKDRLNVYTAVNRQIDRRKVKAFEQYQREGTDYGGCRTKRKGKMVVLSQRERERLVASRKPGLQNTPH